ncbi:MAG: ISL3 family transposase, partial [Bacteroidaceae bacterium]|nr:ISL3 family transposase [Bacteroidaceae bacterium]
MHTEFIPWADGNTRFTEDFCNEVAWMVCRMSRSAVALFEDIDWRTVGNCIKAAHNRIEPDVTVRMRNLRRICVDETSYRKGFSYITVVYDMDLNRVVWIHEGNGLEIFRLFCKELTEEERQKIEIVAGDGAKWIDTCVSEYFPNAARCIDFFHVAEWANEKLDKVRAATAAKAAREFERQKRIYQETEAKAQAAKKELAAMPKRGRPSKRKQELLAILAAHKAETAAEGTDSPKRGRPRKEKFNAGQQKNLDRMKEAVKTVKGSKHALGHNPENCTDAQTERIRLIENSYPDLYRA